MKRLRRKRTVLAAMLIAAGSVGCRYVLLESELEREGPEFLATIWGDAPDTRLEDQIYPLVISVPDTVDAGEPFLVRVRTYLDCGEEKGATDLRLTGDRTVRMTVYTMRRTAHSNCARGRRADHAVKIVLDSRGWGYVTVVGEHRFGYLSGPLEIRCTVVVRKGYTARGEEGGCTNQGW
ncbi:hypothetical protein [Candidatus Palauibacter sp.]|uniref:hypothetical protein n=1 Tax=Candidatus Palauibacter sp. TaxID=3101350 RepID=UPI003B5C92D3